MKYLKKNFIKVFTPHLYASFGTFCVQIGQLFAAQWLFETCLKFNKSLSSKENVDDFAILPNVQRLTVPRIIDQFGHKSCQKKRKDVDYQLLQELFQKYSVVHEQLAAKNWFSTTVIPWTVYFGWICSTICWNSMNPMQFKVSWLKQ